MVVLAVAAIMGVVVTGVARPASAEPSRRVIVSGTVHQLNDETFGHNPTCDSPFFDNDVVYNSQQLIMHEGWGCDEEVYTELIAYADLMPDGAIRYHGKVILREGTCACADALERKSKEINQVVLPNGNALVDTGYISWDGGDATSMSFQIYNGNP